jgi:5-methyltetrahydrofolate--homocysteine methyltransferase
MSICQQVSDAVYSGQTADVLSLLDKALAEGVSPQDIIDLGLSPGMEAVGRDFKANILFVPEVLIAARAMNEGLSALKPLLLGGQSRSAGKIVLGTVRGDLHNIGKNLVSIMWQAAGFDIIDLGVDVPADDFVKAVKRHSPHILALSALLTTTMREVGVILKALDGAGLRRSVKVMVGGAPVTERFVREVGADGYAPDAATAVDEARKLIPACAACEGEGGLQ